MLTMETSDSVGNGIQVTVRDRVKNKSRSFTVYSDDLEKVVDILKDAVSKAK